MTSPNQQTPRAFLPNDHQSPKWCSQLVTLSLERSEKLHLNASPTVSSPMVLEENAISTRGVALIDAPWRWLVDNVGPEDHSELAVTSSFVQQDPPTLLGQPLDCSITFPKTPNFCCWRCLVFWRGSCSNSHLVDFQSVSTLRHCDLFGENILGNVASTELSLIPFPFAKRKT